MCFDADSRPPIRPIAGAAVDGERVELEAEDGTQFAAFLARATKPSGAAIVILPDVRGLYRFYEELALRFAEVGIDALGIDYFGRTAPMNNRGPDFDFMSHVGQLTYAGMLQDVSAGLHRLRDVAKPRATFSVGFCMGGRLSFDLLSRRSLGLTGVIGFYGPPVGTHRSGSPAPVDVVGDMRGALLGLFGGSDPGIRPEAVTQFDMALDGAGVEHEIISYPNAPHSFFDRKAADFADESADAWQRVLDFVKEHTPA